MPCGEFLRAHRSMGVRLLHTFLLAAGALGAAGLGLALAPQSWDAHGFQSALTVLLVAKTVSFELFRLHRCSWRWFGLPDAAALTVANTCGSVLAVLLLGPAGFDRFPFPLLLIDWFVSQGFLLTSRLGYRLIFPRLEESSGPKPCRRVLIYPAGRSGLNLLRELREDPARGYDVLGFIDDDAARQGLMIQMTPVLGCSGELPRLARRHHAEELLVAEPPPAGEDGARLLEMTSFAGIPCRFLRGHDAAGPGRGQDSDAISFPVANRVEL